MMQKTMEDGLLHAYATRASDVVALLGTGVSPADPDRTIIEAWASTVDGRILDVGAGTGRWTGHLARLGHDVEGLEPVPQLVAVARAAHPTVPFREQTIAELAEADDRWSGILAWYSVIHMDPRALAAALTVLHGALAPGGTLLVSHFTGPAPGTLRHPVAPAHRVPPQAMAEAVVAAGFEVAHQRTAPGGLHGILLARRPRT